MQLIGFTRMCCVLALAGSSVAAGGCGGAGQTTSGPTGTDMAVATLPVVGLLCTDARADDWKLPLTKTTASGALRVTLLSSQADVPVIGDSKTTWTIAVADATTGAPVTGAALSVLPWMPDHHHGTSVKAVVTESAGTPGQYALAPLYFFMAGYWTVTITVDDGGAAGGSAADGGAADSVLFSLCLTDAT